MRIRFESNAFSLKLQAFVSALFFKISMKNKSKGLEMKREDSCI